MLRKSRITFAPRSGNRYVVQVDGKPFVHQGRQWVVKRAQVDGVRRQLEDRGFAVRVAEYTAVSGHYDVDLRQTSFTCPECGTPHSITGNAKQVPHTCASCDAKLRVTANDY